MKEIHREVEIILLEEENKWRFTVNGRERTAPTLPKAREYINNALDAVKQKKEKPWEPFDVYVAGSYDQAKFSVGKVTSEAETRSWDRRREFWVTCDGKRAKQVESVLFAFNDLNAATIVEIGRLNKQRDELAEQIVTARKKLIPIEVPDAGREG